MSRRSPRIALIAMRDARDIRSWSGILWFAKDALQRHIGEVIDLTPAPVPRLPLRAARFAIQKLSGAQYSYEHDPTLARFIGHTLTRRIARAKPDLVFAPAGSACAAHVETDVPIVYYSDATWRAMEEYYPEFSRATARSRRGGDEAERLSIGKSALSLFASEWAADSARRHYAADPARTQVLPFGANLREAPRAELAAPRSLQGTIQLLFVGVSWERKGGALAVATLEELLRRGHDVRLTVVGCRPPSNVSHPRLEVIPFLNKSVPAERERLESLWASAQLFLLPTRQEAAGLVFAEAAAYGLPRIATRTGGVPTYVQDAESGLLLDPSADASAWADATESLLHDARRYEEFSRAARRDFETRLNWDSWAARFRELSAALI